LSLLLHFVLFELLCAPVAKGGIDGILQFGHNNTEYRQHDQYGEYLFGLKDLAGKIQPRAEPDLADDHFRRDHEDYGDAQSEPDARKD